MIAIVTMITMIVGPVHDGSLGRPRTRSPTIDFRISVARLVIAAVSGGSRTLPDRTPMRVTMIDVDYTQTRNLAEAFLAKRPPVFRRST